ncbi:MAG: Gfo/Idh/MocA family oxidoreductase, partial [Armatimonadota bacterium]|nr:Gfo/Idh/MocA family oxidoreductase [Armatimonadota bacterium]
LSWAEKSTVEWFIGTHSVDTVRWLLQDEARRVYAVSRSRVLKEKGINTPDFYQVILEFNSGATAVIENSWILPKTTPNIIDLKCEIIGDKGALYLDTSHARVLERYTEIEATYPDILVMPIIYGEQMGFAAESIRHFIDCVLHDREPRVTGEDGLAVTQIIQAIEQSVKTSSPVEIPVFYSSS